MAGRQRRPAVLKCRALEVVQAGGRLYLFSLAADEILNLGAIARVSRTEEGELIGYQRPEVKRHIDDIVEYLDGTEPLFPNAIILALPPSVRFTKSRGPKPAGTRANTVAGVLEIPLGSPADRPAWIVDGQQRALALARTKNRDLFVPISGFVADSLEIHRDQFLRINNTRPLPRGLVSELLPEVSIAINPRLNQRRLAAALCDLLNRDEKSPFFGLIKRTSSTQEQRRHAVVQDTAVIKALEYGLGHGLLFSYRNIATNDADVTAIWEVLVCYWRGVKEVFPEAWGKPPTKSRLMHSVGILSMSRLMDRVMADIDPHSKTALRRVKADLQRIAPSCHWTGGEWQGLYGLAWNEVQNVNRHVNLLSNYLVRLHAGSAD
ncbi:MAG: hypothetical protein QOK05_514 [Chloroflexota bacterium]|jgi:DGQHR domain-containing protein|nr:hypothetical protein [Chloroflexota bacterium]